MKSNLYNEKFSFGTVFVEESNIFQVVRKKVGKSKSKQSLSKKANNGKQIKVKSAWASHCLPKRTALWYIHTGSRKEGQRKMWGLNGQQTNSGVFRGNLAQLWNEVMLKSGNKYRPAVKNGHSKKKKLKAGKVSSCLFCSMIATKIPSCSGISYLVF